MGKILKTSQDMENEMKDMLKSMFGVDDSSEDMNQIIQPNKTLITPDDIIKSNPMMNKSDIIKNINKGML